MLILSIILILYLFMLIGWLVAVKKDNFGLVDCFWGITFIITSVVTLIFTKNINIVSVSITLFVTIWGVRLSGYLFARNWNSQEDYRYQNMRKKWKNPKITALFRVFLLQATISLFFSLGIILGILYSDEPFSHVPLYIGIMIWIIGFIFESVGDYQLKQHRTKNAGTIITHGLWKYTRHPNYFGEAVMWYGISMMASSHPMGLVSFVSPLLLTFFLLKISGVPLLEKKLKTKKGYLTYMRRTNKFIPGPPKND
ncbi:DUF1295 domain-containing protein [Gracilibacillus salinarum]|uniref:DUF1295 domain-containing protein n=1 Tax=Gracilibacillus salinarum TaxID=2932255 RepID=A0ABY4GR51_9BACI|nr:DUF1295 domain-containing protein [Gracilibacillus salinarum]UOQ86878.1 DUF1295 domain-containing protein [Gracilibacillus salinarum]